MSNSLRTLSDRDLMMNLWWGLTIFLQAADVDPGEVTQSLCREDSKPSDDEGVCLADILAETASRLGIEAHNVTREEMHLS